VPRPVGVTNGSKPIPSSTTITSTSLSTTCAVRQIRLADACLMMLFSAS
jgi:hypothetical protein